MENRANRTGGGACNGLIRPLTLGFQPEMGPGFFKGDLDCPAHDDPLEDLGWGGLQVGTEVGFQAQFGLRVTGQHITDVDGGQSGCIPQGGVRASVST